MKHICAAYFLLLLVVIFPENEASTAIYPNATHPDYPGKCYYTGSPLTVINVNETIKAPEGCSSLFCRENFNIYIATCGVLAIQEPCWQIRGDASKPHPHCCQEIIC